MGWWLVSLHHEQQQNPFSPLIYRDLKSYIIFGEIINVSAGYFSTDLKVLKVMKE